MVFVAQLGDGIFHYAGLPMEQLGDRLSAMEGRPIRQEPLLREHLAVLTTLAMLTVMPGF